MTWWRRRRWTSPETEQARERMEAAQRDLATARADDEPVDAVAAELRSLRNRNHFGPLINRALRGSR